MTDSVTPLRRPSGDPLGLLLSRLDDVKQYRAR